MKNWEIDTFHENLKNYLKLRKYVTLINSADELKRMLLYALDNHNVGYSLSSEIFNNLFVEIMIPKPNKKKQTKPQKPKKNGKIS